MKAYKAEDIQGKSITICTPMFGGQCFQGFHNSMCELVDLSAKLGIKLTRMTSGGDALITRARNNLTNYFLKRGESDIMFFIDADIVFDPKHVLWVAAHLYDDDNDHEIVGAPYPAKVIAWEKIQYALSKGIPVEEAKSLASDLVFTPDFKEATEVDVYEPMPVADCGTGFVGIKRSALEKIMKARPDDWYRSDMHRSQHFEYGEKIHNFFDTKVTDDDDRILLSEDYYFNALAKECGIDTYYCLWMALKHQGTYFYEADGVAMMRNGIDLNGLMKTQGGADGED